MKRHIHPDYEDDQVAAPFIGSVEVGEHGHGQPAGVLWVPDPEQRHGWREVYIDKPGSKVGTAVGFRKPGAR
jgi:hypothetical protein